MTPLSWFVLAAAVIGIFGWWYLRRRRQRATRMISFVALLRAPMTIDPTVLAKTAARAWNADLGDGESEGEDGFVVSAGILSTIMYNGRPYIVNCFPKPYVDDPEQASESIGDLRIRELFASHTAWLSCDALGVNATTTEEEVAEHYRLLGKLFAAFLDENWLLIYLPDRQTGYPINEETESALLADDPVSRLQETITVPLIGVPADSPLMVQAVARARENWHRFLKAFEANSGTRFSVKGPVTYGEVTEFIWIAVTAIEGDKIYGQLANDPANLGPLKFGSNVSIALSDLNDWSYVDSDNNWHGGFTIEAVQKAVKQR